MTSPFSFLQNSLKITPSDDGQVKVTVTLPQDLVFFYLRLLDSLTGMVKGVESKVRLSRCQTVADQCHEGINQRDLYYKRIVRAYDLYQSQGLKRTAAIKQISADLRKENHPWREPDIIRSALVAAGRPRVTRRKS